MANPLDPVRSAFEKAVGPHRKRQNLIVELKEADVAKERRAQIVKETEKLDAEWLEALVELWKSMESCPTIQDKL